MKKLFIFLFSLLIVPLFFINNLLAIENEVSIETTNVATDLRILYGGNTQSSFNLDSLIPPSDQDLNFKLLAIKPYNGNLYIYGYAKIPYEFSISSLNITYSDSTTQDENGGFIESLQSTSTRLINTYGYGDTFFKVSIDDFVTLNSSSRFFVDSCILMAFYYNFINQQEIWPIYFNNVNDELFYNIGNSYDNFVYEYFKDDYIVVTDKQVNLFLTGKDIDPNASGSANFKSYYEDFYVFFNTNLSIDELIEAQYSYLYYSYDIKYHYSSSYFPLLAYPGLMDANAYNINYVYKNSVVTSGVTTKIVNEPYFSWWTQSKVYSLQNIQDCNDLSNLESEEFFGFKELITNINSSRVQSNKEPFSWTFKAASDVREAYGSKNNYQGTLLYFNGYSFNHAHEIKQLQILRLKFRTNNQIFDLNALDFPSDTQDVYILSVPYVTLVDQILNFFPNIFNNISNFFKSLFSDPNSFFNSLFDNIVPILIIIGSLILLAGVVFLLIYFAPAIKPIVSGVGTTLKTYQNNRRRRSESKEAKKELKHKEKLKKAKLKKKGVKK